MIAIKLRVAFFNVHRKIDGNIWNSVLQDLPYFFDSFIYFGKHPLGPCNAQKLCDIQAHQLGKAY